MGGCDDGEGVEMVECGDGEGVVMGVWGWGGCGLEKYWEVGGRAVIVLCYHGSPSLLIVVLYHKC